MSDGVVKIDVHPRNVSRLRAASVTGGIGGGSRSPSLLGRGVGVEKPMFFEMGETLKLVDRVAGREIARHSNMCQGVC